MNTMKDLVMKLEEKQRKEVEKTIDEVMKRICCEDVDWRNFEVYESSASMITDILNKMEIHFLLPIAEQAKLEKSRQVRIIITSTKDKYDDIWFVRVDATHLLARIDCSPKTVRYLQEK